MNREIIAKTLVGKGKLAIQEKQVIKLEENISKPLGCWIINHKYDSKKIDKNIELNGTYDIQIWYAYDDDQKTNVFYKTITFSGVFLISWKNIKTIDDETKQKVILHAKLNVFNREDETFDLENFLLLFCKRQGRRFKHS